jgi:biotin-dependent carboxylase-like uncharacterized protein
VSLLTITRVGPLTTLQDAGRFGMLRHGISASGPMDRSGFAEAAAQLPRAGTTAIEFTQAGLGFRAEQGFAIGGGGGAFRLLVNGTTLSWPGRVELEPGDLIEIRPAASGNYGYVCFERELDVTPVLGSRSTNVTVGLGGFKGRALRAGDKIALAGEGAVPSRTASAVPVDGPIRVIWGLHANIFHPAVRRRFAEEAFEISTSLDRMGVKLVDRDGVFREQRRLNLVSDAIVAGDIQILGDGTPTVLMRDHQTTGGYPRIATVVTADFDRFAQLRPGSEVRFRPVTLEHAR